MIQFRNSATLTLLALLAVFTFSACNDAGPIQPTGNSAELSGATLLTEGPTEKDEEFLPHLKVGVFTICKVAEGSTDSFDFEILAEGPGVDIAPIYLTEATLADGGCVDVYEGSREATGPDQVTITEILADDYQVDRVFIWNIAEDLSTGEYITTWHEYPAGTTQISGAIEEGKDGCVAIFYNSKRPTTGEGTGTPGYWRNHPDAWPVEEITCGGQTFTKSEAIALIDTPEKGDKSKTMFRGIVAAKLNLLIGTDPSCIEDEIDAADAWLEDHPVCSNVRGNSDAWGDGESTYTMLNDYNNGRLCAPSRDSGDDSSDKASQSIKSRSAER